MKEDAVSELIKHMNTQYAEMHGLDKQAILKAVAAYFEAMTQAEATHEAMLRAFSQI